MKYLLHLCYNLFIYIPQSCCYYHHILYHINLLYKHQWPGETCAIPTHHRISFCPPLHLIFFLLFLFSFIWIFCINLSVMEQHSFFLTTNKSFSILNYTPLLVILFLFYLVLIFFINLNGLGIYFLLLVTTVLFYIYICILLRVLLFLFYSI